MARVSSAERTVQYGDPTAASAVVDDREHVGHRRGPLGEIEERSPALLEGERANVQSPST